MIAFRRRIEQLEHNAARSGAVAPELLQWRHLCPADADPELWQAIFHKMADLPAFAFHPWRDVRHVTEWLSQVRPATLLKCPGPVHQAEWAIEAERAGAHFEPINFAAMTVDELRAIADGDVIQEGQEEQPA